MSYDPTYARSVNQLPKAAGQSSDIFYGSPLALVGLFVEVIRTRFRGGNEAALPWYWNNNPTPDIDETGETSLETSQVVDGPGVPRKIYIESAYTSNTEARNVKPAIFVDKAPTRLMKPVIGNRAAYNPKDGFEYFYALASVPIEVTCLSEERGESAQIGDFVWFHLMACQQLIRYEFGIHDISPMTLGKTEPFKRTEGNKTAWSTPVMFEVQIEYRWKTLPIAPLLAAVKQTLYLAGNGDSTAGAVAVASSNISLDAVNNQQTILSETQE